MTYVHVFLNIKIPSSFKFKYILLKIANVGVFISFIVMQIKSFLVLCLCHMLYIPFFCGAHKAKRHICFTLLFVRLSVCHVLLLLAPHAFRVTLVFYQYILWNDILCLSFQLLKILFWLRITDEGSVPEMRIWSILLIKSDSNWCKHLSRSLFLYLFFLDR